MRLCWNFALTTIDARTLNGNAGYIDLTVKNNKVALHRHAFDVGYFNQSNFSATETTYAVLDVADDQQTEQTTAVIKEVQ